MSRLTIVVSLLLTILSSVAHAQGDRIRNRVPIPNWVLLGAQHVDFGLDVDRFVVARSEQWWRNRSFTKLHIFVDENDIRLMHIRVIYQNGYIEDTPVGEPDRGIEIKSPPGRLPPYIFNDGGSRQYLSVIEMKYRSLNPATSPRGVVRIIGELSPIDDARDEWVELGCQPVRIFGRDRDMFRVGLREGRFKAIRLHVRHADVYVHDLRVIYINGIPDDIPVRHHVRSGERTPTLPLDLRRRGERAIERVDLVYSSEFRPVDMILGEKEIRHPVVCVEGLEHNVPF